MDSGPKEVSDKNQQVEEGGLDPGMSVSKAGAVSNKLTAPLNQNLGKLLCGSEPQFSHLQRGHIISSFTCLFWRLNE